MERPLIGTIDYRTIKSIIKFKHSNDRLTYQPYDSCDLFMTRDSNRVKIEYTLVEYCLFVYVLG